VRKHCPKSHLLLVGSGLRSWRRVVNGMLGGYPECGGGGGTSEPLIIKDKFLNFCLV
jgi:hypothetical protein